MDIHQAKKHLQAALIELQKLASAIDHISQVAPDVTEKMQAGICLWCHKPIESGDIVTRGVHQACYKQITRRSDMTLADAENRGFLGPKQPPGRRPAPLPDHVLTKMKQEDAELDAMKAKADEVIKAHREKKRKE